MEKKMNKMRKIFDVNYLIEWDGASISKVKKDIEELEKLGATHIEIDITSEYGSTYVDIKATSERLETDEEYQQRIDEEKKREEKIKKRDLEEFERLKSKYNL